MFLMVRRPHTQLSGPTETVGIFLSFLRRISERYQRSDPRDEAVRYRSVFVRRAVFLYENVPANGRFVANAQNAVEIMLKILHTNFKKIL